MFKRFLYLDTIALADYVSSIESGRIVSRTTRSTNKKADGGHLNLRVIAGSKEHGSELEETQSITDTNSSRFDRLLDVAESDPERIDWIEVLDPDRELPTLGIGTMISWECDFFEHPLSGLLSRHGDFTAISKLTNRLEPLSKAFGLDMDGIPNSDDRQAMNDLIDDLDLAKVLIGESEETDWKLICPVKEQFILATVDGPARVVGKVVKSLKASQWQPVVTLPGVTQLSREKRRKQDRTPPEKGHENEYVQGPGLVLDLLALYR